MVARPGQLRIFWRASRLELGVRSFTRAALAGVRGVEALDAVSDVVADAADDVEGFSKKAAEVRLLSTVKAATQISVRSGRSDSQRCRRFKPREHGPHASIVSAALRANT